MRGILHTLSPVRRVILFIALGYKGPRNLTEGLAKKSHRASSIFLCLSGDKLALSKKKKKKKKKK